MKELEYNFTRELKQPHKVYHIGKYPIPFARNGLSLQYVFLIGILVATTLVVALITIILDIQFMKTLFIKGWLLIILSIFVFVWVFFTIKWDNKNFFSFILGRILFGRTKDQTIEHGHLVILKEKYQYQPLKRGRRIG